MASARARLVARLLRSDARSAEPGDRMTDQPTTPPVRAETLVSLPAGTTGRYARATESLRGAAKWLLAALAAVGGVLLAGLQLTTLGGLGSVDWPRLTVAAAAAILALAAVGYMIASTSRVFTDEWVTLADLDDESFERLLEDGSSRAAGERVELLKDLRASIDNDRQGLYGHLAVSVPDLYRRLREANEAARAAESEIHLAQALARAAVVRAAVNEVTDCANYHRTRLLLRRLRPRLAAATAITVAAVLIFAYAANPSEDPAADMDQSGRRGYSSSPSMTTTEPGRIAEASKMSCTITPEGATDS